MRASPGVSSLIAALVLATACGPRQVDVRTAPTTSTGVEQAVAFTNNLSQSVNVYVVDASTATTTTGGTPSRGDELFLRQIPANTVERIAVPNVPAGRTVFFRAVTVDNSRTYQSRNVALAGTFTWSVP